MIEKIETKLVELFEKISIKAILIFFVLNLLVAGSSYFFLESYSKKNVIWQKQIKFNVPRYTVVRHSDFLINYHDVLPQGLLLEKITRSRFEGNLRSICNIQEELFDDHIFYKWMKSSTSRINYSVVLNIRHFDKKSIESCSQAFKKLINSSYDYEKKLYLSLIKDIVAREKVDIERYEKEYEDLLKMYKINSDKELISSKDTDILNTYNLGLFSLISQNKRNIDRLNKQISKIDYEMQVVNKDLTIQIEYENNNKSYKSFIPILILVNVVFSFLLILIYLLLNLGKRTN